MLEVKKLDHTNQDERRPKIDRKIPADNTKNEMRYVRHLVESPIH